MSILSFTIFSIDKFLKRYAQLLISKSDFSFSVYMPSKYTVVLEKIVLLHQPALWWNPVEFTEDHGLYFIKTKNDHGLYELCDEKYAQGIKLTP